MLRDHTQEQFDNLSAEATASILLIDWNHSGMPELISLNGVVEFDSQLYIPRRVTAKVNNGRDAQITVTADNARISQALNLTWRDGYCRIYAVPGAVGEDRVYTLSQGIMLMDGEIIRSSWGGGKHITVDVRQVAIGRNLTPRDRLDGFGNHMPAPGTAFAVGDDETILVVRS